jgi:hypothetical protein
VQGRLAPLFGRKRMSDFFLVRGIDTAVAHSVFAAWKVTRKWVRSVELVDVWEPQHLEINRRDAIFYMVGKHKVDLAQLVLMIQEHGGHAIHLKLRRNPERIEEDLGAWAIHRMRRT